MRMKSENEMQTFQMHTSLHTEDIIDLNFYHYYLSVVDLQVNFSSP